MEKKTDQKENLRWIFGIHLKLLVVIAKQWISILAGSKGQGVFFYRNIRSSEGDDKYKWINYKNAWRQIFFPNSDLMERILWEWVSIVFANDLKWTPQHFEITTHFLCML